MSYDHRRLGSVRLPAAVLALVFTVSLACKEAPPSPANTDGHLNVILVVVDTLRADHLGLYGYPRPTSPHLDAFAQNAVVFDDITAQAPWTTPSVASLFSSLYPSAHGILYRQEADRISRLSDAHQTLAEVLSEAGWNTLAVVANPFISVKTGMAQGFAEYQRHALRTRGPILNRAALDLLDAAPHRPFFLYLHYMDVHGPYEAPDPFMSRFRDGQGQPLTREILSSVPRYLRLDDGASLEDYVGAYDAGIRYWDEIFAHLIEQLRERSALDDTILIVTSDHGEEFYEHGGFNHGRTLYQEQVHVPLIIWSPAASLAARRVSEPLALIDLAPTLLRVLGIPIPDSFQGVDRAALLRGEDSEVAPVFTEAAVRIGGYPLPTGSLRAVRSGHWKAIENLKTGEIQIVDLATDPREEGREATTEEARRARALFSSWSTSNSEVRAATDPETGHLDADTRSRLNALGYIE